MREILFRGKRKDNGAWVEAYSVSRLVGIDGKAEVGYYLGSGICGGVGFDENGHIVASSYNEGCAMYCIDPETLCQYTGLTDKNGRRVFEGDIFGAKDYFGGGMYVTGVVKYGNFNCSCCDGVYGWYIDGGDIRSVDYCEVIGNIHDNPELLEGK